MKISCNLMRLQYERRQVRRVLKYKCFIEIRILVIGDAKLARNNLLKVLLTKKDLHLSLLPP